MYLNAFHKYYVFSIAFQFFLSFYPFKFNKVSYDDVKFVLVFLFGVGFCLYNNKMSNNDWYVYKAWHTAQGKG